mmetsp:Transcript_49645/g.131617  ORF Transcript_49645/g.131617 Transcript_49645/m.131617 type:complete len:227 (-) Transcript_49645:1179-1859(-)
MKRPTARTAKGAHTQMASACPRAFRVTSTRPRWISRVPTCPRACAVKASSLQRALALLVQRGQPPSMLDHLRLVTASVRRERTSMWRRPSVSTVLRECRVPKATTIPSYWQVTGRTLLTMMTVSTQCTAVGIHRSAREICVQDSARRTEKVSDVPVASQGRYPTRTVASARDAATLPGIQWLPLLHWASAFWFPSVCTRLWTSQGQTSTPSLLAFAWDRWWLRFKP